MICEPDIAFAPRWLMEASLPSRSPYGQTWLRQSSRLHLTVHAGQEDDDVGDMTRYVGVPYGTCARLVIAWLTTEVVKTGSPDLDIGKSAKHFFSKLGLASTGGKRGTIAALKLQLHRLLQARFHVQWAASDVRGHASPVIDVQSCLDDSACGVSWPLRRQLTLSTGFFNALREHAVPFNWGFFRKIAQSTIAVDLYWLLSSRATEAAQVFEVSWSGLAGSLGTCATPKRYAQNVMHRIESICAAAGFEVVKYRDGLVFKRSRLSFQDTRSHRVGRFNGSAYQACGECSEQSAEHSQPAFPTR